jgi:hypothetical protein
MIAVQGWPQAKGEIVPENFKAKRTGSMAEVFEHLHRNCKSLSSNPRSTYRKKGWMGGIHCFLKI